MKKAILLIFTVLLFSGYIGFAGTVDIRDARVAGKNFYYERIYQYQDIAYASITIADEFTEMVNGQPVWYVFNFSDGKGYIIVSADDAAYPVIGYSFNGYFNPDGMPSNLAFWMEHYRDQIVAVRSESMPADEATVNEWARLLNSAPSQLKNLRGTLDLAPLMGDNAWDQGFPWNEYCPEDNGSHVPVGCVATAMTMIMYYWRFPETGQGYHCITPTPGYGPQCADFGATTYEWNGMDNEGKNSGSYRESIPLATVSWHGGIAVNMNYAPGGSGAYTSDVPYALKNYFKYGVANYYQKTAFGMTTWMSMLRTSLDAFKPIEYSGSEPSGGHAWVCDGYQGTDYFHMNWGWAGSYNGYFYLTSLNPGGYSFNQNQAAVMDIEPPTSSYPSYCTGLTIVEAYDFGSIEDGSGPKADYQNNASCNWLIAPDDSVSTITLKFYRFALDASDNVTVYDGPTTSSTVLGTFTGTTIPGNVTSTGPQMLVVLTTDGSGTDNGFQADYETTLNSFCPANLNLTGPTAEIGDGSDRFEYRNSTQCKWYIKPDGAETTTLTFTSFNTETDQDKVTIYDLGAGTLLQTYSGEYTTPPAPVTSESGQMLVVFSTNNTVRGEGWDAYYTITVATPEIQGLETIRVYPNPTTGMVNVSFNATEEQSVKLEVVSLTGKTVFAEEAGVVRGTFSEQLDLSNLAKGVYTLRITGGNGVKVSKVILQ